MKFAAGQVFDIYSGSGVKVGRVTLNYLRSTTHDGDEMWTTIDSGCSSHNVSYHVRKGLWRIYSQHPLNGG